MAEHVLPTIIELRYDTYSRWMNNNPILKQGEAAVAVFLADISHLTAQDTPGSVGIKIGDGVHYFDELPWIQAIAADVYAWAKTATKPIYEASEIVGLQTYIEQYGGGGGGSGGSGISSSAYRLVYNSLTQKYTLQYQDSETGDWIDTTSVINLSDIFTRLTQIENWANGGVTNIGNIAEPLILSIRDEVITQVGKLDYNDTAVAHQFVTEVDEVNGKIEVLRSALSASDITSGTLDVARGGLGVSSLEQGSVIIGNDTSPVTTKPVVSTILEDDKNSMATTGAIIKYVAAKTAGLTGAMHFVGEASVLVNPNSSTNPQIQDYNFNNAQPGDVILANNAQELVWTGAMWRLLGDEGSYAVKGSIKDADIDEDAAISLSKIDGLTTILSNKVDKVEGKGLSTNDYTTEEKTKLSGIQEGAQANTIEHIFVNDVERIPTTINNLSKSIDLQISVFDDEHREKLDGIAVGANVNEIEHIFVNGAEQPIITYNNKTRSVNITFTEYTLAEKSKLENIEAEAQVNKIETIKINGTTYTPDNNKQISITIDQAALNLDVIAGARVPKRSSGYDDVDIVTVGGVKKLELARIAKTGNVSDLIQSNDEYITLYCGTSTEVI